MLFVIIAFVCLLATAVLFAYLASSNDCEWYGTLFAIIAIIAGGTAVSTGICIGAMGFDWKASPHKAAIINREYGTSYTREEIFYASDVIETIRALDRKRIEINGDILSNGIPSVEKK